MSASDERAAFQAGRLIQWGLRPKANPFNEPEYRELIDCYIDRPTFRALVRELAEGLGLVILTVSERGLFLGTQEQSIFAQRPSDFRSGRATADDRLLDGLVQVAIAATIYPRQRDLDEDALEAKPPISSKSTKCCAVCARSTSSGWRMHPMLPATICSAGSRKPGGCMKRGRPHARLRKGDWRSTPPKV